MFKRFKSDITQYWKYAIYATKASLKSEVANSYLNWLWWILDPLCFMVIYVFMFGYVFHASEQYFGAFVFIGITLWDFFNKTLIQSVKLIKNNKAVVSKVYLPKFVLLLIRIGVNGFKMCISLAIVAVLVLVYRVPLTLNVLYVFPILLTLVVIVFGFGCFFLHFGVFVEDLSNVLNIVFRFLFYITGIFWNIQDRLAEPYSTYLGKCNPVAFLLTSMRKCVLYGEVPARKLLIFWFVFGVIVSILGVRTIYKSENSYVKLI